MNIDQFYRSPKELFACHGFYSKITGEQVELTPYTKLVLIYMLDRTKFFVDHQKGQHYETQISIGNACGMEYRAAARALKVLTDHGVIKAEKIRNLHISPHKCWYYRGIETEITLWKKDDGKSAIVVDNEVPPVYDDEITYSDEFLSSINFTGD